MDVIELLDMSDRDFTLAGALHQHVSRTMVHGICFELMQRISIFSHIIVPPLSPLSLNILVVISVLVHV